MEIANVAHSTRCALLLDAAGVCRWFVMKVDDQGAAAAAKRCVGAQFVASIDPDAPGLLAGRLRVGNSALFARVDDGRISLVRFGPIVQYEALSACETELSAHVVELQSGVTLEPDLPREAEQSDDETNIATHRFTRDAGVLERAPSSARRGMPPGDRTV